MKDETIVSLLERIAESLERIEKKLGGEIPEKYNDDRPNERFYGYHNCQRD